MSNSWYQWLACTFSTQPQQNNRESSVCKAGTSVGKEVQWLLSRDCWKLLSQICRGIANALRGGVRTRDELYIVTKLFNDDHSADDVRKACDAALQRLGLNYLDLYLVHWWAPVLPKSPHQVAKCSIFLQWHGRKVAYLLDPVWFRSLASVVLKESHIFS